MAAASLARESSWRIAADQIGLRHTSLKSFVEGSKPQKKTIFVLTKWYYSRPSASQAPSREDVDVALAQILLYVHDAGAQRIVRDRRLKEVLEQINQESRPDRD